MTDADYKKLVETIISAVAKEHRHGLKPDDPLMILPTVMKVLSDQFRDNQKLEMLQFKAELCTALKKTAEESKAATNEITLALTKSIKEIIEKVVKTEIDKGGGKIRDVVKSETQACFSKYSKEFADLKHSGAELKHSGETISFAAKFAFYAAALAFMGGMSAVVATLIR